MTQDQIARKRTRLLNLIRQSPGISRSELTKSDNNLPGVIREAILADLQAGGLIVEQIAPSTHGPDKKTYWPTGADAVAVKDVAPAARFQADLNEARILLTRCLEHIASAEVALRSLAPLPTESELSID